MRAVGAREAAGILGISVRSVRDRRFRQKIGLIGRKLGRRLVFAVEDCERLLNRGAERFPKRSGGTGAQAVGPGYGHQ
jgi:hypothetical protein